MIKLKSQYPGVLVTIAVDGLVTLFWNENVGVDVGRIDENAVAKITASTTADANKDELRAQARKGGAWMETSTINRMLDEVDRLDWIGDAMARATTKGVYFEYNPDDGCGIWLDRDAGDEPDFDGPTLRKAIDVARATQEPKP